MYTVVRFVDPLSRAEVLEQLGRALNQVAPGSYSGLDRGRRVGIRFSCGISNSDDWDQQQDAVIAFLGRCAPLVRASKELGIVVGFDMAIQIQGSEKLTITCFDVDHRLANVILNYGVSFMFSIYHEIEINDDPEVAGRDSLSQLP